MLFFYQNLLFSEVSVWSQNNGILLQGIDTDKPLLQIGSYVFSGEYEDALGTCILFEENSGKPFTQMLLFNFIRTVLLITFVVLNYTPVKLR